MVGRGKSEAGNAQFTHYNYNMQPDLSFLVWEEEMQLHTLPPLQYLRSSYSQSNQASALYQQMRHCSYCSVRVKTEEWVQLHK